ncbi:MAG: hypothetical protein WCG80_12705 [Spirochaetales bacterium]
MTPAQLVEGVLVSLGQLIPNTRIRQQIEAAPPLTSSGFQVTEGRNVRLWFCPGPDQEPLVISLEREMGLTDREMDLLRLVPPAIAELSSAGSQAFLGLGLKFSNKIGFGDLLVARFLDPEKADPEGLRIGLLAVLQDLSFRYYEDKRCSSGFCFTSDLEAFTAALSASGFLYSPFETPVDFHYDLFSSPASFRYVDGRNSYYVVDAQLKLHGIVRLKNPDQYSLVARLRNQHLKGLLAGMPGQPWVAFVGLREEVFVIVSPEVQLKWSRNHWQLRDRSLLFTLLARFGLATDLQELLVSLFFALSEGGLGASILIPEDSAVLPTAIGKIDHTEVGDHLRALIQKQHIAELNATNSLLGIVSSDGLTTISRDGRILRCGDIIDISRAALLQSQGGGRSQAGIAASFFGLSIKISQNGPVSFWHRGELLLQF